MHWGENNAVTYDISKTEAILFSKARNQKLNKQLSETKLQFGGQVVSFSRKATRWLGMWFDSSLSFVAHISERLKNAKMCEGQDQGTQQNLWTAPYSSTKDPDCSSAVSSLIWSRAMVKNQKNHQNEFRKLINRQARAITGMCPSTPIAALMNEAGLIPANILLDFRQRKYAYRILSLPDSILM